MSVAEQLRYEQYDDKTPFSREDSGLVNLEDYVEYLLDDPETVPLNPISGHNENWVRQHVYFKESGYRQLHLPVEKRDMRLVALRNAPYSQIYMRPILEVKLHKDKEFHVEPPPSSTIDLVLQDYENLDSLAAATLGIRDAQDPNTPYQNPEYTDIHSDLKGLSVRDRINIFRDQRSSALESLASPKVLAHRVVASAVKRISMSLEDPFLERVAKEKIRKETTYYPLRAPKDGYLRNAGNILLRRSLEVSPVR